ncbi:MAG TPA: RIO1 family regulatory kinase/ATPase [Candidatus Bathyarchaeia archaeon]|nr:RIO1 family regulatory kinase/ATPase [Candidatus Bathyarchaeia archaeon]
MSAKELASARSCWKRRNIRDGRRSRYVEVEEVSLDTVRADAVENGLVDEVVSILATGKEADVYVGLRKNVRLALKVYPLHRTPHRKKSAIGYSVDRVGQIAANEFTILEKAYRAGVRVPTPARRVDNMFTMRFLGGETHARQLKDVELFNPEATMRQALEIIEHLLLDACIIHGDLSEYNLLLFNYDVFVIDFPQAVDLSSRVNRQLRFEKAQPLLQRDLENVGRYFAKYDLDFDSESEYERLVREFESRHLSARLN